MSVELILIVLVPVIYLLSFLSSYINKFRKYNYILLCTGFTVHFALLVYRIYTTGQPPFTSLYGNLILLPFLVAFRLVFWKRQFPSRFRRYMQIAVFLILFAASLLPASMQSAGSISPALDSFWMFIHVPAYFLGYMSMIIAFVYAILVLSANKSDISQLRTKLNTEVKIGFFFLNFGMISGALWAYQSWGNYWSWDPKETWALINILILSLYFYQPRLKKKATIVIIAFISIIFTYIGVNFILPGLHSYL